MTRILGFECPMCIVTKDAGGATPSPRDALNGVAFGLAMAVLPHRMCDKHQSEVWRLVEALRMSDPQGRGAGFRAQLRVIEGGKAP